MTIAKTKPDALFFAVCVLGIGLAFRAYSHKISGLRTVHDHAGSRRNGRAQSRRDDAAEASRRAEDHGRGARDNPRPEFALEEAQLRKATLCVVYVKEIAVYFAGGPTVPGRAKWQDDPEAAAIMSTMMKRARSATFVC